MSRIMEEMRNDVRIEIALKLVKRGKNTDTLEEIAECSGLPLEKIAELAAGESVRKC